MCGVDENGHRDIIAAEPMTEESRGSYGVLFQNLKDRGLSAPRLIISDAHAGLVSAIRESFPGASWQRYKVHFMRTMCRRKRRNPSLRYSRESGWRPRLSWRESGHMM